MENCIFCQIVKGELDAAVIWENVEFLAILDAFPNTKGMTLVMPKKHYDSYLFDIESEIYQRYMEATKIVVKLLEEKLGVQRVAMVMEGLGVNHAHIKLYPLHGLNEKFTEIWANEQVYFEKYEGYITTKLGPKADLAELKELAEKIRK